MNTPRKPRLSMLVKAAKRAATANAKAHTLTQKWVSLFEARYGHDDISDSLVEIIDYSTGNTDIITAGFIEENSLAGQS